MKLQGSGFGFISLENHSAELEDGWNFWMLSLFYLLFLTFAAPWPRTKDRVSNRASRINSSLEKPHGGCDID